jgi:transcriptional regulator with XRE-family HTH domain
MCKIAGMETTAKQIAQWALDQIREMDSSGMYKNETQMYAELAALGDMSMSLIRQFHQGARPNPTADTIDRMVFAIKAARRLHAA